MVSTKVLELASDAGLWYTRTIKLFGWRGAGNTRQPEHNLIGGYAMDTLPHYALSDNPDAYYVYTLAYPDGRIFYIGKGRRNRINEHELYAKSNRRYTYNKLKISTIKEIWDSGHEVVKNKVAFFSQELDAYMYEWAMINMSTYAEELTNLQKASQWPTVMNHRILTIETDRPLCFQRREKGKIHHQVSDIVAFCRSYKANTKEVKKAVESKAPSAVGWNILWNCRQCSGWCEDGLGI
jgi:hypothetical protein